MKKCTAAGTARRTRAAKVTRGEAEHVGEREREPYLEGTRAVEAKSEQNRSKMDTSLKRMATTVVHVRWPTSK